VAKFTFALAPSKRFKRFSIRAAQEEQVIPVKHSSTLSPIDLSSIVEFSPTATVVCLSIVKSYRDFVS
ncbi:unnamed protein product, partial [Acidithrix sp. C25]